MAEKKEESKVYRCVECNGSGEQEENGDGIIECDVCGGTGEDHGRDADEEIAEINDAFAAAEIDPASPEGIALHDRETARLVWDKSQDVRGFESAHEAAKEAGSNAKKRYEASVDELRSLIAERHRLRGVRPQKTLFSGLREDATAPEPAADWRDAELHDTWNALGLSSGLYAALLNRKSIDTLGHLSDLLEEEDPIWLTPKQLEEARTILAQRIDAASKPGNSLDDLYLEYPITLDRWQRFGLTAKDVERLISGETKNFGANPITVFGDIQRFVTPNPANPSFTRSLKDFKGFGDAGYDRYQEAETKFWAWWSAGGKEEFAKEKGLIRETVKDAGGEVRIPGPASVRSKRATAEKQMV